MVWTQKISKWKKNGKVEFWKWRFSEWTSWNVLTNGMFRRFRKIPEMFWLTKRFGSTQRFWVVTHCFFWVQSWPRHFFGGSPGVTQWRPSRWFSWDIHVSSLVTNISRKGFSRLRFRSSRHTSKRSFFCWSLKACGTHLQGFQTFPIWCRWRRMVSSSTQNLSASALQVWVGSDSISSLKTSSSTTTGRPERGASSKE